MLIDCANGVGAPTAEKLATFLGPSLSLTLANTAITTEGALNNACGADYVKTSQKLPPSLAGQLKPGQRACSLDGDADRLIYYYMDDRNQFHMLDGDKIAALVAAFIVDLVKLAGLEDNIEVGVVQTAYANGASTKYLAEVSNFAKKHDLLLTIGYSVSLSNAYQQVSNICIKRQSTIRSVFTLKPTAMEPSCFRQAQCLLYVGIHQVRLLSRPPSTISST